MAKINLGMSGGVDSAVAAYILKNQGYDVQGINMLLCPDSSLSGTQADACRDIADKLGIGLEFIDMREEFRKSIIDTFVSEYENGRTPNPCCLCNRMIKFKYLDDGESMIATGHYAQIAMLDNGRYAIRKAENQYKDQSYFLYGLSQDILARTVFPLAMLDKNDVRRIADDCGFINAHSKDSQDICFIPDGDYAGFITRHKPQAAGSTQGNFVDMQGNVLGEHKGYMHYTVGQRKGLGISLGKPVFVYAIDTARNEVILADEEYIFGNELTAHDFNWMAIDGLAGGERLRCKARIRYRHKEADCTVYAKSGSVCIVFDEPQRAITPGQSVVLYDGDVVLGGGIID